MQELDAPTSQLTNKDQVSHWQHLANKLLTPEQRAAGLTYTITKLGDTLKAYCSACDEVLCIGEVKQGIVNLRTHTRNKKHIRCVSKKYNIDLESGLMESVDKCWEEVQKLAPGQFIRKKSILLCRPCGKGTTFDLHSKAPLVYITNHVSGQKHKKASRSFKSATGLADMKNFLNKGSTPKKQA